MHCNTEPLKVLAQGQSAPFENEPAAPVGDRPGQLIGHLSAGLAADVTVLRSCCCVREVLADPLIPVTG